MSDNIDINPSELFYAIKDIELSLEEIGGVKKTLDSLANLDVDVSSYKARLNHIEDNLDKIHKKVLKAKETYMASDEGIRKLFKYLNDEEDDQDGSNNFNDMNFDDNNTNNNKEQMLDEVKGNNKDLGGKITNDATSIMRGRL